MENKNKYKNEFLEFELSKIGYQTGSNIAAIDSLINSVENIVSNSSIDSLNLTLCLNNIYRIKREKEELKTTLNGIVKIYDVLEGKMDKLYSIKHYYRPPFFLIWYLILTIIFAIYMILMIIVFIQKIRTKRSLTKNIGHLADSTKDEDDSNK